jgi:hypothetical protein
MFLSCRSLDGLIQVHGCEPGLRQTLHSGEGGSQWQLASIELLDNSGFAGSHKTGSYGGTSLLLGSGWSVLRALATSSMNMSPNV